MIADPTPECFYVYVYYDDRGSPYYVGKGTKRRYISHLKMAKKPAKNKETFVIRKTRSLLSRGITPNIKILIDRIDEEFAFLIEKEFISLYGRRDNGTGILTNCTDGGDGITGLNEIAQKRKIDLLLSVGEATRFQKGKRAHNFGIPRTEEEKRNHSMKIKGRVQSPEERAMRSRAAKGINKGRVYSPEVLAYRKQRRNEVGYENTIKASKLEYLCPHCQRMIAGKGAFMQWHNDNCKDKNNGLN